MSFPAYEGYQDSGVRWLGEIPSNWNVVALKYIARLKSGDGITGESIEETGEYPVYGGNGLRGYTDAFTHDGHYVVVGRQGALCGNINYANGRFWASEHAVVASPIKSVDTIWLGEMLRAMNLNQYSVSAAQPGLSMDLVGNLRTVLPPPDEQRTIASFLDTETSKIDSLVSEQRRLIELLKEKRQAVISHAVTKGLDPSVPMKDSGIEWLGEVPEHWSVLPLHRLVQDLRRITYGIVQPRKPDKNGRFMIRNQDFTNGWADPETIFRVSDTIEEPYVRARFKTGDLLMTIVGAGIGNVGMIPDWLDGANTTQNIARIAVDPAKAHPSFVAAVLSGPIGRQCIEYYSKGAAQPSLNLGHLREFVVTVPPLNEQGDIAAVIQSRANPMDTLLSEAERAIELLQERRTALISTAVTGKIDVREFATEAVA
jgi:type I restriction enzyme S subunit